MIYPRPEPARIQRALESQNQPTVDDGTFNDNYDPIVAQRRGGNPPGTPNTDCYGLRTEPFNECAYFLDILQRDNRITAYYGLLVQNLNSPDFSQPFVEGIAKSIYNQANGIDTIVRSLAKAVFSQVGGSSYWEDEDGNKIDSTQPEYNDPNLDLSIWTFNFFSGRAGIEINVTDYIIYSNLLSSVDNLAKSLKGIIPFDPTGAAYIGDCREATGFPFSIDGVSVKWPQAVREIGPDAVRRGKIEVTDNNYEEEASFYNMCLTAKECIKEYRESNPDDYESDLANLTNDQIESLNNLEQSSAEESRQFLTTAFSQIEIAYSNAVKTDYYSFGKLNNEALYRIAITAAALRNIILVLLETTNALDLSFTITEYRQILADQKEEQERILREEEEMRILKQIYLSERFDACRIPEQPLPNKCADKVDDLKTFMADWTTKDRNSPYYSKTEGKYYLVLDIVLETFVDISAKTAQFKSEVYRLLNNKFSLGMPQEPADNQTSLETLVRQEDIYLEARSFKPSKILYSIDETLINLQQAPFNPRFSEPPPDFPYLRTYSYTISDFFYQLEKFERMLKKYAFDFSLWNATFGNVNPEIRNMSISTNPVFKNLKMSILKQDYKNFQMFRPLFSKLLSLNGIGFLDDRNLLKGGQYGSNDRIILFFSFDSDAEVPTVSGTTLVSPEKVNSLTKPPTNNNSTGLIPNAIQGKNVKLHRVQIKSASRPAADLLWKANNGLGGNLDGLNTEDVFQQETAMNYLLNMDTILSFVNPRN